MSDAPEADRITVLNIKVAHLEILLRRAAMRITDLEVIAGPAGLVGADVLGEIAAYLDKAPP